MSGWYRLRQFWQNVAARPLTAVAQSEVSAQLTPAEMTLFQHFSNSDQWHSYRVMKTLQAANHIHPDLLTAALLHDVGKTRVPLSVWERSWVVVGQVIWPKKTAVWGQDAPLGWKRPFVVKAQHPAWGGWIFYVQPGRGRQGRRLRNARRSPRRTDSGIIATDPARQPLNRRCGRIAEPDPGAIRLPSTL